METAAPGAVILVLDSLFGGRYRVARALKTGGMGAVYEVVDERTNARRALKIMLPTLVEDADMRARFSLEARVTGDVESDHLTRVYDAGVDAATGMPFIAMDLLRGEDLGAMCHARGPLPPGEVLTYLTQAALALDRTHAAGIVHRDLKPGNLFVSVRDDGSPCVKILDYGIAKVVAQGHRKEGTQALGTPLYMAPEQIRGKGDIGAACDVYALGHIAYTLLVGEAYWDEDKRSAESLFAFFLVIVAGPPEKALVRAERRRGVDLPSGFDAWFRKATAARPEDRWASAGAAAAALGPALDTPTTRILVAAAEVAREGMGVGQYAPRARTGWWWVAGGAVIGFGALAVLLHEVPVTDRPPPPASASSSPPAGRIEATAKIIEEARWLVSIGDMEGGHAMLTSIPDALAFADDPDFQSVEHAWAEWKLEQVGESRDAVKQATLLREIASAPTASAHHRAKAAQMLRALQAADGGAPP